MQKVQSGTNCPIHEQSARCMALKWWHEEWYNMTIGNWPNDVGRFCPSSGYSSNYLSRSAASWLISNSTISQPSCHSGHCWLRNTTQPFRGRMTYVRFLPRTPKAGQTMLEGSARVQGTLQTTFHGLKKSFN